METKTIRFQSDKIYSTYWWVIQLDMRHQANYNALLSEITGYSKAQGHDEAKDKAYLLMSRIIMLYSRGYFDKGKQIDFYMKQGEILNKQNCIGLVSLKKTDYSLSDDLKNNQKLYANFIQKGLLTFLTRFYQCITEGKDVKYLLPKRKTTFSKDEYTNVDVIASKMEIKTEAHLNSYAEMLIKNGHAFSQVMNFVTQYQDKYFNT